MEHGFATAAAVTTARNAHPHHLSIAPEPFLQVNTRLFCCHKAVAKASVQLEAEMSLFTDIMP